MTKFLVLIADDDPDDRMLIQLAIKGANVPIETKEVYNGEQVIEYLKGEGRYANRGRYPFPDVLLLDLKMPRMNGLEVLEWIRTRSECFLLPTIMLSGSSLEEDVAEAHRRGVKAFFTKPRDFNHLKELIRLVAGHWNAATKPRFP